MREILKNQLDIPMNSYTRGMYSEYYDDYYMSYNTSAYNTYVKEKKLEREEEKQEDSRYYEEVYGIEKDDGEIGYNVMAPLDDDKDEEDSDNLE